jgi:hypothetical protein
MRLRIRRAIGLFIRRHITLRNGHVTEILFLSGRLLFGGLCVDNGVNHLRNYRS